MKKMLVVGLFLLACSSQGATGGESSAALDMPVTAGCAWRFQPLWGEVTAGGCWQVKACPGTTLAPATAGIEGACEVATFEAPNAQYCDDAPWMRFEPGKTDLVAWQRTAEQQRPQFTYRGCP